ncbi:MAG TPA: hypothetical protein VFH51_04790, partial [Myxococcota bacterium]|nr:hypothetical protein [Myxococcota bacterium]
CGRGPAMLLVLGMHRSGTSALARLVSLLGAALPRRVMDAGPDNVNGYWEPTEVVTFNDGLLEAAGGRWDALCGPGADAIAALRTPEVVDAARRVLADNFDPTTPLGVLKDPRLSRLLPFWRPLLEAQGFRLPALVCVRHPLEVAASLAARNGFSEAQGLLLWLGYTLDAERYTRGAPRAFVSYADVLAQWQAVAERLGTVLEIAWPRTTTDAAADVTAFLQPAGRHHVVEGWAAAPATPLHRWCKTLFTALAADEAIADVCDAIRPPFEALVSVCEPIRANREAVLPIGAARPAARGLWREAELWRLRAELTDLRAAHAALEAAGRVKDAHHAELAHSAAKHELELLALRPK